MFDRTRITRKRTVRVDSNPGATPVRVDADNRAAQVGVTSLMEDDVCDAAGNRLGAIEEMILDTRTGCVRYVVLAFGGFLGIGRKRAAIPWSALTPDLDYRRCVLDMAQMRLMGVQVSPDDPWLSLSRLSDVSTQAADRTA
jgi:sporulation protein YlmC with PRC-barrel domain